MRMVRLKANSLVRTGKAGLPSRAAGPYSITQTRDTCDPARHADVEMETGLGSDPAPEVNCCSPTIQLAICLNEIRSVLCVTAG